MSWARKKCVAHHAGFSPGKNQGKPHLKLHTPQKVPSIRLSTVDNHIESEKRLRNTAQGSATAPPKPSKFTVSPVDWRHTGTPDATSAAVAAMMTAHDADAARSRAVRLLLVLRGVMDVEARPSRWALVRAPGTHGEYLVVSGDSGPALEVSEEHLREIESIEEVDIQQYLEACFE